MRLISRWMPGPRPGRAGSLTGSRMSVGAPSAPGRLAVWACAGLAVLVSVATLVLRGRLAFYIAGSSYDDLHFVQQAAFLGHGQWLGPYDKLTLAKGPSYPAFVASVYRLGLDLKVAEQLTTLAAAAMVALSVWLVTRRLWLVTAVYVLLALNPISFTLGSAGVLRDGWYASLCILFPATVFVALYGALSRVRWGWWLVSALLGGLAGAAMWLCREEGLASLPPAFVVVVALPLVLLSGRTRDPTQRRSRWWWGMRRYWRAIVAIAVVGAATLGPIAIVSAENHSHYGVALTNDTANGTFVTAYSEWSRVRIPGDTSTSSAIIPIGQAQREAVYLISSAARELQPVLENPQNPWLRCGTWGCDLPGAFTIWAIRDAAEAAGHFSDAPDTQAYFGALASQIQQGCSSGVLTCSPALPGPLQTAHPSVRRGDVGNVAGHVPGDALLPLLHHAGVAETRAAGDFSEIFSCRPRHPVRRRSQCRPQCNRTALALGLHGAVLDLPGVDSRPGAARDGRIRHGDGAPTAAAIGTDGVVRRDGSGFAPANSHSRSGADHPVLDVRGPLSGDDPSIHGDRGGGGYRFPGGQPAAPSAPRPHGRRGDPGIRAAAGGATRSTPSDRSIGDGSPGRLWFTGYCG